MLGFRGSVTGVKAKGTRIMVEFEINPEWDFTESEKVKYLMEWIPAKVKAAALNAYRDAERGLIK